MAQNKRKQSDDVREILVNTVEVQLAAMKAGVVFWGEWAETASNFNEVASKGMIKIGADPGRSDEVLAEITDASREYLRKMSELPLKAAEKYKQELGRKTKQKKAAQGTAKSKSTKKPRSVRVKP